MVGPRLLRLKWLCPAAIALALAASPARSQVVRWIDGQVIPGTEGISVGPGVDLSGWNSEGHNLQVADFQGLDLSQANFANSWLKAASFTDAIVRGANFGHTKDFEGLGHTASYRAKDLQGIGLAGLDLSGGWDFRGQDLTDADLSGADLTNVDLAEANLTRARLDEASLQFADLRGAQGLIATNDQTRNAILPDGSIAGLELSAGDWLTMHDYSPVKIESHLRLSGRLPYQRGIDIRLDDDGWDSPISFEPGIPVQLGNTLSLYFEFGIDPATFVGRTWDLFDWTGVATTGQFAVASSYRWDLSKLYTTGEVTLLSTAQSLAGDVNYDNKVDLADFGLIRANMGSIVPPGTLGDADGSGWVNLTDYGILQQCFGNSGAVAVPEPSTFLLAALAGFGLLAVRQNRVRSKR